MAIRTLRVGDLLPLQVALREESGAAVNLTGATVTARMVNVASGEVVIADRSVTVESAAQGFVSLEWSTPDTATGREGIHDLTFRVTIAARPRTFPVRGPIKIQILPR